MAAFFDALRFLTRLPVPSSREEPGFGARAFPLVGLVVGLLSLGVDLVLGGLDPAVRNVAILGVGALVTGAIHYDGLADTLDALGGATAEERLRIMRDGAIGTFAVLGLVFVVAAELAALSAVSPELRWPALVLAPVAGRMAMLLCAFDAPLARSEGLGAEFVKRLQPSDMILAATTSAALLIVLAGFVGVLAGLLLAAASYTLRTMVTKNLGGVTGDVLGASGKISETLVLLVFAAS